MYRLFFDRSKFKWRGPSIREILKLTMPHQKLLLSADDMFFLSEDKLAPLMCCIFWKFFFYEMRAGIFWRIEGEVHVPKEGFGFFCFFFLWPTSKPHLTSANHVVFSCLERGRNNVCGMVAVLIGRRVWDLQHV
jgi:hypothetical protein